MLILLPLPLLLLVGATVLDFLVLSGDGVERGDGNGGANASANDNCLDEDATVKKDAAMNDDARARVIR